VEGVVLDPRFIGGVAVAGVVIAGQLRNRGLGVDTIAINTPTLTAASAAGRLLGIATTRTGRDVSDQIVWRSKDNAVLQVQPDGSFVVGKAGLAPVTATVGGRTETVFIEVKP
jgi:hypothetical protein